MNEIKTAAVLGVVALLGGCTSAQQPTWQTFAGGGQSPYSASNPLATAAEWELINIVTNQLGVSPQQALGGVGAIFSVAQQRMNPGEFSQLSRHVPQMDRYLSAVPRQVASSESSALWGAAGELMGGQNSNLGNLAMLAGSFQSLGMDASMVSRFVPVMLQYLQTQGGAASMNLLQRALY